MRVVVAPWAGICTSGGSLDCTDLYPPQYESGTRVHGSRRPEQSPQVHRTWITDVDQDLILDPEVAEMTVKVGP